MRKPFRYVIYLVVGMLIYQVIDSGESSFSHHEVRNTLIILLIVVFVLLLIVRIIKQRNDNSEGE
ncbi:MAG: hypothetical protein AAFY41_00155 [Bacteroidota bacterium]